MTSEKLFKHVNAIEEQILPRTIRDSISVTRAFGIRYLRVDAYCIVQDNCEDKLREIRKMMYIYKNSFLTIIAAKAKGASNGVLDGNTSTWQAWDPRVGMPRGNETKFSLQKVPDVSVQEEPISGRAWKFQERILSPWILCFRSRNFLQKP